MSLYAELGEVAEFINGVAFKPVDWTGKGKKIVRIQNLNDKTKPYNRTERNVHEKYVINEGDILVSWSASLGVFVWNEREQALLNQHIFRVVPNESIVCKKYLIYVLHKALDDMKKHLHEATMKHVNRGEFLTTKIPLPPLKEQKRIAAILDKADTIRRKRQQSIDLTDQLLRSVFQDMFGDPVTNPKGWKDEKLINLVSSKLQNGAYFPKENYSDSGVEMVHMSDVFYDIVQRGSLKRVLASEKDVEKYNLTYEDLLISRRSLTYEGAAKPSLIPRSKEPLIFESSMIRLTPNQNKVLTRYLFQYLSDSSIKTHFIRKYVTGATIKGISQKNLESIRILVPPIELQEKFIELVDRISDQAKKLLINENSLHKLVSSLTKQAFKGELTKQTKAA